jgi:hypothetical protein
VSLMVSCDIHNDSYLEYRSAEVEGPLLLLMIDCIIGIFGYKLLLRPFHPAGRAGFRVRKLRLSARLDVWMDA